MKPDDVATAITQALVQGGAQWMISSIAAFLPALWTMTLILHLGRPYVLRILRRCGLRLGADVWWMSYLLMRDAVMLITFALSWIMFQPNIVASSALPITGSLAALLLLLALAVKLSRRVDDDIAAYRLATVFIVLGATLYFGPLVWRRVGKPAVPGRVWSVLHQQHERPCGSWHYVGISGWSRSGCRLALHPIVDVRHPLNGTAHDSHRHNTGTNTKACTNGVVSE